MTALLSILIPSSRVRQTWAVVSCIGIKVAFFYVFQLPQGFEISYRLTIYLKGNTNNQWWMWSEVCCGNTRQNSSCWSDSLYHSYFNFSLYHLHVHFISQVHFITTTPPLSVFDIRLQNVDQSWFSYPLSIQMPMELLFISLLGSELVFAALPGGQNYWEIIAPLQNAECRVPSYLPGHFMLLLRFRVICKWWKCHSQSPINSGMVDDVINLIFTRKKLCSKSIGIESDQTYNCSWTGSTILEKSNL